MNLFELAEKAGFKVKELGNGELIILDLGENDVTQNLESFYLLLHKASPSVYRYWRNPSVDYKDCVVAGKFHYTTDKQLAEIYDKNYTPLFKLLV